MLRPGVTREWVSEGELPKERTQSEVAEALRCVGRGHTWRDRIIGAARELDCFSAHICLREPGKSEDKTEGRTSMESSIPCSHGGRALVMKRAEEVENAEANYKYQDTAKGQRPKNFIRPVSTGFSSREPKVGDFRLMQECSTKERSR
ncbi:hypothetical protein B296_00047011 [Ensete ventricosum]|uniref:Uncharacterized protein n=1 Tax=Ensete ventricosum TaxID=4639 RepID=A0A426XLI7_ENSVE|nr:hypothetical protein B296_00047011 [Ensete ventricosum]